MNAEIKSVESESPELPIIPFSTVLPVSDPMLSKVCVPVEPEWLAGGEIFTLLSGMRQVLEQTRGLGLAANQVGSDKRVITLRVGGQFVAMINPVITHKSGNQHSQEACLSVSDGKARYLVKRSKVVRLKFFFPEIKEGNYCEFNEVKMKLSGIEAIAAQHEVDHLNGISITKSGRLIQNSKSGIQ